MIRNLIIAVALIASLGYANANDVVAKESKHSITRPMQRCVNGIVYYVAKEYVFAGPQGFGYGFFAPKVDYLTLQFIRCRKDIDNKIIEEN